MIYKTRSTEHAGTHTQSQPRGATRKQEGTLAGEARKHMQQTSMQTHATHQHANSPPTYLTEMLMT